MTLRQPLHGPAAELFEYSGTIPIIDTHEHIPGSEADYNAATIHFGNLFNPYISNDLYSAGMPFPQGQWPAFVCIEQDWDAFEPYWRAVRHGSYARPLRIALQEFYGVDDLTRENHEEIVNRINENNKPGIFQHVFVETCRIAKAIRCAGDLPAKDDPLIAGNISSPSFAAYSSEAMDTIAKEAGAGPIKTLEDLVAAGDRWMERQVEQGAMQFKSRAMPIRTPERDAANELFEHVRRGGTLTEEQSFPLMAWLREANVKKAGELDVPVAFHTGVWGDYRICEVADLIDLIQRHPATRMDIYHLGIPHVRDAVMIAKNFPNAWMNLCWAHIVAGDMVVQTLREAIDMVPMNKMFAFGADYVLFVEKVFGHLWMARENVSIVLGERVQRQLMDLDEAKAVMLDWFYENPRRFYRC